MDWIGNASVWNPYVPFATVVSGLATGLAMLVGGVSLLLIWWQAKKSADVAHKIEAFDAHKEYIKLCIEHPRLSSSGMMLAHLRRDSFAGILDDVGPEIERALWFVSYVLFAMEQLASSNSTRSEVDPAWKATICSQLSYHAELLAEVWPVWKTHYGALMDRMVFETLTDAGYLLEGDRYVWVGDN